MLRKIITLSIITAVVLIGVENLIAQEATDKSQTEPGQRQRGRVEQFRGQQMDSETRAGRRTEAMRGRRRQEGADKIEAMKKERRQEAAQKGTPRGRVGRRPQRTRPGQNRPMQQMLGRWNRGRQGRGMGRWGRGVQGRGMGRWGRGFQGRGMGGWGRGLQGRGICPWGRGFQGRGMMGGVDRGFQGRGMSRRGLGMPLTPDVRPFPQNPPQEDVLRPAPPMQRRGMGRRGRALQEPNAPEPGPRRRRPGRRVD